MVLQMNRVHIVHLPSLGTQHSAGLKLVFNVNCLGVNDREAFQGKRSLGKLVIICPISFALSFARIVRIVTPAPPNLFSRFYSGVEEDGALGKPTC